MIGWLKGEAKEILEDRLILSVGGVGYEVFPRKDLLKTLHPSSPVEFYVFTHVKEDSITLYGFESLFEKKVFELLTSVSGVGSKTALTILSTLSIDLLFKSINGQDASALTRCPGIGKRTAERIIVDLKDRVLKISPPLGATLAPHPSIAREQEDVVSALENLGYRKAIAENAVLQVQNGTEQTFDQLFREALKVLGKA